jgi:ribosomal protein L29
MNNRFEQDKAKLIEEKLLLEKRVCELNTELNELKQEQIKSKANNDINMVFSMKKFLEQVKSDLDLNQIDVGSVLESQDPLENSNSYLNFFKLCLQSKVDLLKEENSSKFTEKLNNLKGQTINLQFEINQKQKAESSSNCSISGTKSDRSNNLE